MRRMLAALGLAAMLPWGAQAQVKDELVIGMAQFPTTFQPSMDASVAKSYIHGMTRRPFTVYDKDWKLVCMLCTELPTLDNGRARIFDLPDGKKGIAVRYTIQPGARWGDGVPVTTDDVVFTWEVGRDQRSGISNLDLYRRIIRVEAHDAKNFTLHVDKVSFEFAAINDFLLLPAHIERANFSEPESYRRRTAFDTATTNPGLYFGPYRITQVVPGSHVVMEPNPTWWGTQPYFKRITVRVIENTAALEANLLSGSIDYIAGELGLSLDQALAFEKRHGQRFDITYKSGLIYEHIDLNLDNPVLKDKRVRQALLHALDRETLVKQLFEGKQPVAHSFVSHLDWIAFDDVKRYAYDPARARALFDAAGFNLMQGGIRQNAAGQRLSFELMTTAGNRVRETVQQVLQAQWRQVGVEIRIKNEPARVFFGETTRQRQFTGMAMFAWVSSPENVPRSTLHSDEIPRPENAWAGQNYTGFRDAEMDDLIEATDVELDREKRRVMWRRIQDIYVEELPVLPLYSRADPFVVPKWLAGIEPTGHQYSTAYWVENWRVR
jgi:peptide/nickel transport system substrate-binding protein